MKKNFNRKATLRLAAIALTGVLLTAGSAMAQLSLGLQGGIAKSNIEDANTIYGGGANLRVFLGPQFAIGIAGKIYADGKNYRLLGQDLDYVSTLMPVTGTLDFFLTDGAIRPYIGGDAGVYFSKARASFNGNTILDPDRRSNFGAAPRAGILFDLGQVGIQVEGIYHFVFANENRRANVGTADNIDFESTSRFGGINVGLVFGIGKR
ncbi:hypothetical protein GCM10027275_12160 [Rhabdobacter roseus]|uniref:Outer membrane protein beta-barrel domain-containing protein n=1 Tax=Rhabdobacter roseus TaxID=1655419 RepID=A0A840TIH1_9BACT|nr:hypothetical protein [Rhabdobacter roseus]MBB5283131.1 hypothetical protein [Rhabdobacter roseus]